jgi:cell division protein ZapA (FtsZ GTPase activity inhibitor)
MAGRAVQVTIGGQRYRLVTSASDERVRELEAVVNEKLHQLVPPGRAIPTNALLLVAMGLANDLLELRAVGSGSSAQTREALIRMLGRVESALAELPDEDDEGTQGT